MKNRTNIHVVRFRRKLNTNNIIKNVNNLKNYYLLKKKLKYMLRN